MTKSIPIFCATDENYAPFAALMMRSVLKHTKSFIEFYVMDGGIKPKTKKLIEKDLKKFPHKKIIYVDMTKYDLNQFPDLAYYSVNTFSRYFIPQIVPNLGKILYLDVDIIVTGDIGELYNQDLEGYALGAMPESKYFVKISSERIRKYIFSKFSSENNYFNAGVLLLDVQRLKKINFTQNTITLTNNLSCKLECPDQDVLNILFEQNYKQLDYRFNFMTYYANEFKNLAQNNSIQKPLIIHYVVNKPWKEHSLFQQEFDEVMNESLFRKSIEQKYRSKKEIKYFLFGKIPLGTRYVKKSDL